jgi:hypothetical protein
MSKRVDNARLSCRVPHAVTVFLSYAIRYRETRCQDVIPD